MFGCCFCVVTVPYPIGVYCSLLFFVSMATNAPVIPPIVYIWSFTAVVAKPYLGVGMDVPCVHVLFVGHIFVCMEPLALMSSAYNIDSFRRHNTRCGYASCHIHPVERWCAVAPCVCFRVVYLCAVLRDYVDFVVYNR